MTDEIPRVSDRWWQESGKGWHVISGDALLFMLDLPDQCIDLTATDPPYSSGGAFRGDRTAGTVQKYVMRCNQDRYVDFEGDARDQRSYLAWCSVWFAELYRLTKPGGIIAVFTDWRQLGVTLDAIQAGGFVLRGVAGWDKTEAVRPQPGRMRQQLEFIVWGTRGPRALDHSLKCVKGVFRHQTILGDRYHIAQKPVQLMVELLELCPEGGLVFDPFAGTGTTGVAAARTGRHALLADILEDNARLCVERLQAEERQLDLSMARAGQGSIFDMIECEGGEHE